MSVLTPGTTFSNGEQLTASDLNLLLQGATFTQSSVDNQSTQLVGTAIVVADGGIIAAKLAADAVQTSKIKDANVTTAKIENSTSTATGVTTAKIADSSVTKAKMENISAPLKVLGRTTAGAGVVEEVTINNDNAMSNASASTLATDASIKQYVDTAVGSADAFDPATYIGGESVKLPNDMIMKFGSVSVGTNSFPKTITFGTAFSTICISVVFSSEVASLGPAYVYDKVKTGFKVGGIYSSSSYTRKMNWQAFGY
jgi:hypothetical protein